MPEQATTSPDFVQLGSDVEDNSSHVMYTALREGNTTVMYRRELVNASDLADEPGSFQDKRHVEKNVRIWPWVRLSSIIKRTNHTEKAALNIGPFVHKITREAALELEPFVHNSSGTVTKQPDADSNAYVDREERAALLKSVKRQRQRHPGAFYTELRRHTVPTRHTSITLDVAVLMLTVLLCLSLCFAFRIGVAKGPIRAQVEALHVSSGHDIQDLFQMKERYDCCHCQPMSPGLVFRLEGIVTVGRQGKLVAPLSKQDCVHFSASAASKRHDGIHALPVAFQSVCVDFTITLLDAPHVQVAVSGQDVALFDIKKGTTQDQRRFSESPDHWQDFILTHRAFGTIGASSAALRSENASLEFREVALVAGSVVTCVGELRRGHDGVLRLAPFEDVSAEHRGSAQSGIFAEPWRTSWERPEAKAAKSTQKVFVSDDRRLLKASRPGWVCLNRHSGKDVCETIAHPENCVDNSRVDA
jgi:hypothetical protein